MKATILLTILLAILLTGCISGSSVVQQPSSTPGTTGQITATAEIPRPFLTPSATVPLKATYTASPIPSATAKVAPSLAELRSLLETDLNLHKAITRYQHAMSMQRIQFSEDEINHQLVLDNLKDVNGQPLYVAEIAGTPLFLNSNGRWVDASWKNLAPLAGLMIGHSKATAYTRSWQKDSAVVRPVLADGNVFFISHDLFWWSIEGPEDSLRPSIDTFNYKFVRYGVEFARSENMELGGNSLLHSANERLPDWLTKIAKEAEEPRETVLRVVREHITRVVSNNKEMGRILVVAEIDHPKRSVFWADVLDQPIDPVQKHSLIDQLKLNKDTNYPWMDHLSWMKQAYVWADEANSEAKLYYNDFDLEYGGHKADQVFAMLNALKALGTPIDGIAYQGHLFGKHLADPTSRKTKLDALADEIQRYHEAGFDVIISELDLNMAGVSSDEQERLRIQAEIQHDLIKTLLSNNVNLIVHFSGIDRLSWMEDPERGGPTADPTSFSDDGERKPNYYAEQAAILEYIKTFP